MERQASVADVVRGGCSYSPHGGKMTCAAGLDAQYQTVLRALTSPPGAIAIDAQGTSAAIPQAPARVKARRGFPLVKWVWPSNSAISQADSNGRKDEGDEIKFGTENPMIKAFQDQGRLRQDRIRKPSGVVTGKVCEPIRPTRLDLSMRSEYAPSSRVIYTAKGGYVNPADAPAQANGNAGRPPALKFPLPSPREAPWLDSAGSVCGAGGWGRTRAHSANSASTAGLQSPGYLRSTTVSQAKAVEPWVASRAAGKSRVRRSSRARRASRDRGFGNGSESDGVVAGGGTWGAGGMLESLGGFLGLGKGNASADRDTRRGKTAKPARDKPDKSASKSTAPGSKLGNKVLRRLRKSPEPDSTRARHVGLKLKVPRVGSKASGTEQRAPHPRTIRRDERDVLTMHTNGVLRPEGLKLRIVKASGRTLEDTKFHMEIRTLRPGQVWSVCRRHYDFNELHSCLHERFPGVVLPRLPRPPTGGVVLEPATLERTRAGLQSYLTTLVADVPAAWGLEEFIMFLDSDEKGRRLFARKRKKENRRVFVRSPPPPEEQVSRSSHPDTPPSAAESEVASPEAPELDPLNKKSLLDLKVEEKKLAIAALEGAAQNHFDGVGAVMNTAVSFSDDEDFQEDGEFIDGEDAIRAMLDRDAKEAEDDNLFSIPAGTDFGNPLDDGDDDDAGFGDFGEDFDINYHG